MSETSGLLTLEQAMEAIHCGRSTLYEMSKQGRIKMVKLGRKTLVTQQSVNDLQSEIARNPLQHRGGTKG